jgi:hypothetical protein
MQSKFYQEILTWLDHIKMDFARMGKILEWESMGSRQTGRMRIRWLDDECNDWKVKNTGKLETNGAE